VKRLRGRNVSLGAVVWIVIGLIVAANHHFLDHLDTISRILSAVLAVAVWPLVVIHVHFGI
jgi:ABC-type anion transport system duplicated permease subunit